MADTRVDPVSADKYGLKAETSLGVGTASSLSPFAISFILFFITCC